MERGRTIKDPPDSNSLDTSSRLAPLIFFLCLSTPRRTMSGEAERALPDVSTAESVFRGAAEAPSEAGARVTGKDEVVSRPRVSLVFPAVGNIAGSAAMEASVALATRKDTIKMELWKEAAGNQRLIRLLCDLDDVFKVRLPRFWQYDPWEDPAP